MNDAPGLQPLYQQVYTLLVRRIAEGAWRPAEALPSEQMLASELGVSQGTVRKALNAMVMEKLVERRQGKGTFVAEHTQERALFQFFRLRRTDGTRVTPESGVPTIKRRLAKPQERHKLELDDKAKVVEIRRTRLIDAVPTVAETVVLPLYLFPDIDEIGDLPNTLYSLYQSRYGMSVVEADEQLRVDTANREDARRLEVEVGTPLLHIDRIAIAIDGKKVEWRISRLTTNNVVYAVSLS
ncbi:GntR family transcriptional regulator [Exilibacterium tricleocarpae]|uniref:GntR family transcriptional regulator n=1 Tax=Exilibacterium tricleocarpae TaxID=2591008 RepID=A0A545SRY7_9GAMM|nr:GntR family transcriptional regulator [Exilibacterium tricleocarpae]TQV67731.1 GntR family transcriptional regulator [Exilibacterium tricleocarpae]